MWPGPWDYITPLWCDRVNTSAVIRASHLFYSRHTLLLSVNALSKTWLHINPETDGARIYSTESEHRSTVGEAANPVAVVVDGSTPRQAGRDGSLA